MLVDQLDLDPLAIEANLALAVKDANGRSYNRTKYLTKRFDLVQQWADYRSIGRAICCSEMPTARLQRWWSGTRAT